MTDLPAPRLLDRFGRAGRDLRVSVTDRCNLRCSYCMPAEGLDWLPKPEMLTDDELVRLVAVMVGLGVTQVRLTGGEPLLRRSLVDVVGRIAALEPRPRIAMTTNGIGLDRLAAPLAAAGLDRVNVSLDTIDPEHFGRLTRRDRFNDVVAGLKAAADAGLTPVKVNAVAMRGVNDTDVPDLLQWCLDRGYELRFIEQMPLDAQHAWDRTLMVSQSEILERLGERFTLTPVGERGSAPAELFLRRRRPRDGRRHRQRLGAVLRQLRPGAAHRRRPAAQLPVRPPRGRPARPDPGRRHRRGARRPGHRGDVGQEVRPRHRQGRLRAAGPPDVSDRWLSRPSRRGRRARTAPG